MKAALLICRFDINVVISRYLKVEFSDSKTRHHKLDLLAAALRLTLKERVFCPQENEAGLSPRDLERVYQNVAAFLRSATAYGGKIIMMSPATL
jgi:hypothetical protein